MDSLLIKEDFIYLFFDLSLALCTPFFPRPLSPVLPQFPFFLGHQKDLNQRSSLALAFLSVYHTTRPRPFVEIYRIKERYFFACSSSNRHNNTTEIWSHVYYSCINAGNKKHAHFRNALSLHVFQLAMAHQINFLKLSKILADHDWCIEWCKENNLLPSSLKCPRAGCHNALSCTRQALLWDGYKWRCSKRGCRIVY